MEKNVQKNLQSSLFALSILYLISFVLRLIVLNEEFQLGIIIQLGYSAILFYGYLKAKEGNQIAGIIGLIMGILLISTIIGGAIIDCLLGIFTLIHSIKYNKEFQ